VFGKRGVRVNGALALVVVAALGVSACGGDDAEKSSAPAASASTGGAVDVAEAKKAVEPYIGKASEFPLNTPLSKIPKGSKVAYMDCGTPTCAVFFQLMSGGAKAMGIEMYRVKAGSAANTINAAFDSVVAKKPDAVIDIAIDPKLFPDALKQLKDAKIPIIGMGVVDTDKYGFAGGRFGTPQSIRAGELLANYVYAEDGAKSNSVFYYPPELSFAHIMKDSYIKEFKRLCPDCTTREAKMPIATLGNTMPSRMVSDLQANPDTTTAVTATSEMWSAAPQAFKAAGIDVKTTGGQGNPETLQMVKAGQVTSNLSIDYAVMAWSLVDMAARAINGEEIPAEEAAGYDPQQFLTKDDITFDPAKGWTGYPDFPQRFMKLWGVKG
jgi:ribose transport system substrate-binding protein